MSDEPNPLTRWLLPKTFFRKPCPDPSSEKAHAIRAHKDLPLKLVVYYSASHSPQKRSVRLRHRISGRPIFYTSFRYEANGRSQTCTREELCTAFATLVGDWDELFVRGSAVMKTISGLGLADREASIEDQVDYEARFWARLVGLRDRSQKAVHRLRWGAALFGEYLQYLSKSENRGVRPNLWIAHPNAITAESVRFPDQQQRLQKPRKASGALDDWAFRAAKIINASEPPAEVEALHLEYDRIALEILDYKGYGSDTVKQCLPERKKRAPRSDCPSQTNETPPPYEP